MSVELEIKRGSTFVQTLVCVDDLDGPIDLTAWTYASDLKLAASNEKLLEFTIDGAAAADGQLTLEADAADTLNLPPSMELVFDVKFTAPDGDVHYSDNIYLITSKHITH